jgi:hypothetical protein
VINGKDVMLRVHEEHIERDSIQNMLDLRPGGERIAFL